LGLQAPAIPHIDFSFLQWLPRASGQQIVGQCVANPVEHREQQSLAYPHCAIGLVEIEIVLRLVEING
jgi:hypothetical protein